MFENLLEKIKNRFQWLSKLSTKSNSDDIDERASRRERAVVSIVAFIMAMSLWFIVNLNSDYNININVPLELGTIPDDMALVEGLPEFIQVEVSGDGWKLINLYNNPPDVFVDVTEGEVNLFDQVRQRFSVEQDVSVLKVQPFIVNIGLEPKISKKVPIRLNTDISFMERYGVVGTPTISPDSVMITGSASQVADLEEWIIPDTLALSEVRDDVNQVIEIGASNPLLETSINEITYFADISEFTESEITVYIRTQDLPRGKVINYNPSAVSIRFDVPLEQYTEIQNLRPYEVYVPYNEILRDSTGFVTPDIELIATEYQIKLRSFQPKAVAYFSIVDE
ncbi:MAG: CdaR family protein [Balneolaceae bacterium]